MKTRRWPISKYVGTFPKGEWIFVKNFSGTHEDAIKECLKLEMTYPKTGRKKNHFRIWDQR
jgi:hypothetical protein